MSSFNPNSQKASGNSINPDEPNYAEEWSLFKAVGDVDMDGQGFLNLSGGGGGGSGVSQVQFDDLSARVLDISADINQANQQVAGNLDVSGDVFIDGKMSVYDPVQIQGRAGATPPTDENPTLELRPASGTGLGWLQLNASSGIFYLLNQSNNPVNIGVATNYDNIVVESTAVKFNQPVGLQGNKITSLGAPTASNDAATKDQVDSHPSASIQKQNFTVPASGASTFNITAGDYLKAYIWIDRASLAGANNSTQTFVLPEPTADRLGQELMIYISDCGNVAQLEFETPSGSSNLIIQRWDSGTIAHGQVQAPPQSTLQLQNLSQTSIADANFNGTRSGLLWDNQLKAQRFLNCQCAHNNVSVPSFQYVWFIRSGFVFQ